MNRGTKRIALPAVGGALVVAIAFVVLPSRRPPIAAIEGPADAGSPSPISPNQPQSPEGEVLPAGAREPAGPPTGSASRSSLEVEHVPLEVEVVDWDMREVAGARVTVLVEADGEDGVVDVSAPSTNAWETDPHGRCTVSLPEKAQGPIYLFAERSGVGTSGKAPPIADQDTGRVRLVLYPQAHFSGGAFHVRR